MSRGGRQERGSRLLLTGMSVLALQVTSGSYDPQQAATGRAATDALAAAGAAVREVGAAEVGPALLSAHNALVLELYIPTIGDGSADDREARSREVLQTAGRYAGAFRLRHPDRTDEYCAAGSELAPYESGIVQVKGSRAMLVDPFARDRFSGLRVIYAYDDGGEVPDLLAVYRDRRLPEGQHVPRQDQRLVEGAWQTAQSWGLTDRYQVLQAYSLIRHHIERIDKNHAAAATRRPIPGDERNALELVLDGVPPARVSHLPSRKTMQENCARAVRDVCRDIAGALGRPAFRPGRTQERGVTRFAKLYWALHTIVGTSD